jgi:hypothetical protein
MNLTRIISIKERIAISPEWKPDERDFILESINEAIKGAGRPNLSMEDLRVIVIALRKAADHTPHPDMATRERELAYRIAKMIPPPFTPREIDLP